MSLYVNLTFSIEEKVKKEYEKEKGLKYQQKINRTNSLSMTRDIYAGLFLKKLIKQVLKSFDKLLRVHGK